MRSFWTKAAALETVYDALGDPSHGPAYLIGWQDELQRRRRKHLRAELMDQSWSYSDLNQIHSDDPRSQKSSFAGWQVYSGDVYSLTSSCFTCSTHLKKDAAAFHFPPLCFVFLHVNILGDAGVDLFKLEGKTFQENSFFLYTPPTPPHVSISLQSSSIFSSSCVHIYSKAPPTILTFCPPSVFTPTFSLPQLTAAKF